MGYFTPDEKVNGMTKRLTEAKYHSKHFHPVGCPVYILNDVLQDSKTQPKWLPRSRVGAYLGISREHT